MQDLEEGADNTSTTGVATESVSLNPSEGRALYGTDVNGK